VCVCVCVKFYYLNIII